MSCLMQFSGDIHVVARHVGAEELFHRRNLPGESVINAWTNHGLEVGQNRTAAHSVIASVTIFVAAMGNIRIGFDMLLTYIHNS